MWGGEVQRYENVYGGGSGMTREAVNFEVMIASRAMRMEGKKKGGGWLSAIDSGGKD